MQISIAVFVAATLISGLAFAGSLTQPGGTGDVLGPDASTDSVITTFSGADGKTIQVSPSSITSAGIVTHVVTANGATEMLNLTIDPATAANGDEGQIAFDLDSGGVIATFGRIGTALTIVTSGAETAILTVDIWDSDGAGILLEVMRFVGRTGQDEVVVNDTAADLDFRVEGIGEINALFVRGSDGNVGIGTSAPGSKLHLVDGSKTSAGEQVRWNIGTDDGGSTMEMAMRVFGGATGADRYVDIQSVEQGVSVRALALQPSGGNVGISTTTPDSKFHVIGGACIEASDTGCTAASGTLIATALTIGTGTATFTGDVVLKNGTTTTDGGLAFDRTNEDLSIGDGSASRNIHVGAWKTWTPTFTGFLTNPGSVTARYTQVGKMVIAFLNTANGTSNATTFTVTLPVAARTSTTQRVMLIATNNGTTLGSPGMLATISGSTIANLFTTLGGGGWVNTGPKKAQFTVMYETD